MMLAAIAAVGCHKYPPTPISPRTFGPGFTDLSAPIEQAGLVVPPVQQPSLPSDCPGIMGDLDGDGKMEIVVNCPGQVKVFSYDDRDGGQIVPRADLSIGSQTDCPMAILDLDGDGFNDVVGSNIYWGDGTGKFIPWNGVTGMSWAHSPPLALGDIDGDGWLDILLPNRGPPASAPGPNIINVIPILRTGLRSYEAHPEMVDPDWGICGTYSISAAPLLTGKMTLSALGDPCDWNNAGAGLYLQTGVDANGRAHFSAYNPLRPDLKYIPANSGFDPTVPISKQAPMGMAWGDIDRDGRLDMVVTTDPEHWFFAGQDGPAWASKTADTRIANLLADSGKPMKSWGLALIDLDQDELLDAVFSNGDDHGSAYSAADFIGPAHISAEVGTGGFAFADATTALHLDRRGKSHDLAVGDLDGDGDPDLIVAGQGEIPRLYRNDIAVGNHGFALRLHGTTSNSLGLGALVYVRAKANDPERLWVPLGSSGPLVLSEPLVFVGLGTATTADTVRIVWPSGMVQVVHDLAAGGVHDVTEPALLTLTPANRHAPADGTSSISLLVTARNGDGSLAVAHTVTVEVIAGSVTVGPPVAVGDGSWRVSLTAARAAGSAALRVHIDGAEVGIHPRVWWD